MTKFRAVIEKTVTTRAVVLIEATTMREAARRLADFADGGSRRSIVIAQPYDESEASTRVDVVRIEERT